MTEPKIAYVTKYALSEGIFARPILAESNGRVHVQLSEKGYRIWLGGNERSFTPEAALARAEEMRIAKIASLKKQIAKLEKLRFEVETKEGAE